MIISTQSFLDTGFAHYKDFEEQIFHKLKGERCLAWYACFSCRQLPRMPPDVYMVLSRCLYSAEKVYIWCHMYAEKVMLYACRWCAYCPGARDRISSRPYGSCSPSATR